MQVMVYCNILVNDKKNTIRIAKMISLVLGVPWIFTVILTLLITADISTSQTILLIFIFVIFNIGIPLGSLFYLYKKGKISDLDVTKRDERFTPLAIAMVSFLISLILTQFVGDRLIFEFSSIIFIILLINLLITFLWKISLHMGINIASSILVNALVAWKLPVLFLSIPLVYWSRRTLHRHSPLQLIAGCVVSGGIALLGLRYFGYI